MILNDSYKTYVVEEKGDNTISIKKNNDEHQYDVLEVIDDLSNDSFCVLNHLFVNEAMEDAFEKKFLERPKYLQNVPGFKALRFLRPQVAGRHYIILTLWEERQAFYDWQNSNEYSQTHKHRGTERGVDRNIVNRDLSHNVRIELSGLESKLDLSHIF